MLEGKRTHPRLFPVFFPRFQRNEYEYEYEDRYAEYEYGALGVHCQHLGVSIDVRIDTCGGQRIMRPECRG